MHAFSFSKSFSPSVNPNGNLFARSFVRSFANSDVKPGSRLQWSFAFAKIAIRFVVLLALAIGACLWAETPSADHVTVAGTIGHPAIPSVTLTIFHDRPMQSGLMPVLLNTLRYELAAGDPDLSSLPGQAHSPAASGENRPAIHILSGEDIAPGIVVESTVTVFLHGQCASVVQPPAFTPRLQLVPGALGWVQNDHGHIDPFVHVECSRVASMLAETAYGRNQDQRNGMMAAALSRVILHEWVHVATQSPHHSREGVTKAEFTVKDLLAGQTNAPSAVDPVPSSALRDAGFFSHLGSPAPSQPALHARR